MLWQHALKAGRLAAAHDIARAGMKELRQLKSDFDSAWPARNKGTTEKSSSFLNWRIENYRTGILPVPV